ncbi:kelch repeat-containing protein [Anaerotignum propionicum]|nr:kelch repeat-containing protein [Anaerotignum propionicum]MEA5057706.1 kelch repeat-containing protein [Anaerotignum propionicum]
MDPISSAEVYDPSTITWTILVSMSTARATYWWNACTFYGIICRS